MTCFWVQFSCAPDTSSCVLFPGSTNRLNQIWEFYSHNASIVLHMRNSFDSFLLHILCDFSYNFDWQSTISFCKFHGYLCWIMATAKRWMKTIKFPVTQAKQNSRMDAVIITKNNVSFHGQLICVKSMRWTMVTSCSGDSIDEILY